MNALTILGVTKTFKGVRALDDVSLDIEPGELMFILGHSGCGKSTLLDVVAGLEEADAGEIRLGDQPITDLSPRDRDVAMVFQSYALYPHMTVRQNMGFGLKMHKHPKEETAARGDEGARLRGIADLLDRKPRQLSGGERQRVAMGRALARRPQVFLLDEPLSNLDALLRAQIRSDIKKLHAELGTTMVLVTHDQVEAMTLADRMAIMDRGRIVQVGTPADIYGRPRTSFVASFLGSPGMNIVEAMNDGVDGRLRLGASALLRLHGDGTRVPERCLVGFRPEDVALIDGDSASSGGADGGRLEIAGADEAGLRFVGEVEVLEPTGADLFVSLDCAGFHVKGRFANDALAAGQRARFLVDHADLHFFDSDSGERLELGMASGDLEDL